MIILQPWEKCVARWICGPAFLVAAIGFLLLPWSLVAWYVGIYSLPSMLVRHRTDTKIRFLFQVRKV